MPQYILQAYSTSDRRGTGWFDIGAVFETKEAAEREEEKLEKALGEQHRVKLAGTPDTITQDIEARRASSRKRARKEEEKLREQAFKKIAGEKDVSTTVGLSVAERQALLRTPEVQYDIGGGLITGTGRTLLARYEMGEAERIRAAEAGIKFEAYKESESLVIQQRFREKLREEPLTVAPTRAAISAELFKRLDYDVIGTDGETRAFKEDYQVIVTPTSELIVKGRVSPVEFYPEWEGQLGGGDMIPKSQWLSLGAFKIGKEAKRLRQKTEDIFRETKYQVSLLKIGRLKPEEYAEYLESKGKLDFIPSSPEPAKIGAGAYYEPFYGRITVGQDLTPGFRKEAIAHELIHLKTPKALLYGQKLLQISSEYKPTEFLAYRYQKQFAKKGFTIIGGTMGLVYDIVGIELEDIFREKKEGATFLGIFPYAEEKLEVIGKPVRKVTKRFSPGFETVEPFVSKTFDVQMDIGKRAGALLLPKFTEVVSPPSKLIRREAPLAIKYQKEIQLGVAEGAYTYFREKPVQAGLTFGVGTAFGLGARGILLKGGIKAKALKAGAYTLGGVYVGAKGIETVLAPTPRAKGRVVGEAISETGVFIGGARFGTMIPALFEPVRIKFGTRLDMARVSGKVEKVSELGIPETKFKAVIGKGKKARIIKGVGLGEGLIYELAPERGIYQARYKYEIYDIKKPKKISRSIIDTEGIIVSVGKETIGRAKTVSTTFYEGKTKIQRSLTLSIGKQIVPGEFPKYLIRSGDLFPSFTGRVAVRYGRVGILGKIGETVETKPFAFESKFTPEEYGKLLIRKGSLRGIYEKKLGRARAVGRYWYPDGIKKAFIELDPRLPLTRKARVKKVILQGLKQPIKVGVSFVLKPRKTISAFKNQFRVYKPSVLRHEIFHHLYPELAESEILSLEAKYEGKPFKEIDIKERPIKTEYFKYTELGLSTKQVKKLYKQSFGIKLKKLGKKASFGFETILEKPKLISKEPTSEIFPEAIFEAEFQKGLIKSIRATEMMKVRSPFVAPVTDVDIETRRRVIPEVMVGLKEKEKRILKARQAIEARLRVEEEVIPMIKTGVDVGIMIDQEIKTGLATRVKTRQILRKETIVKPIIDVPPPPPPPTIKIPPPILYWKFKQPKKKKRKKEPFMFAPEYVGSLYAAEFGIFGKKVPKIKFGIRPLII